MILAHFIGKKKWQIDARSRRRVEAFPRRQTRRERRWGGARAGRQLFVAFSGRSRSVRIARSHSHEVFRGAVDIDDFDLPVVVGGETGPLKCMRRTSILRARNSWIGGSTLPSHKSRA